MFRIELSYRFSTLPSELDSRMTVADYVLLAAAEAIEPRGEARADLRSGIIAAAVSNPYRGKNARRFKPADFMPRFGPRRRQDPQRLKAELKAYTLALGGTVTEGGSRGLN